MTVRTLTTTAPSGSGTTISSAERRAAEARERLGLGRRRRAGPALAGLAVAVAVAGVGYGVWTAVDVGGPRETAPSAADLDALVTRAGAGDADARYTLGRRYEAGDGVLRDYARAAELYRVAAELDGHPGAQYALGSLHYRGLGVENDFAEAIRWYRLAADGGHAPAQHVLARMLETGWGVKRDPIAAYAWYTLAMRDAEAVRDADSSFDPAAARRALAATLNRYQIDRGEKRARDWRPRATRSRSP